MEGELAVLVGEVAPYVTAAVGAFGGAVLARANDQAADATVGLGRRILRLIFGTRAAGEVPEPVADLAADPGDPDLQAALRVAIYKLLAADAELAADLRGMLAGAPVVTVTAAGERSIAGSAGSAGSASPSSPCSTRTPAATATR